jgi:hypothetical protein
MIKFNEVTWYSKFAAVIFFLGVLPAWTFYIGTQYEKTKSIDNLVQVQSGLEINEDSEISGALQGYYYSYLKSGEYENIPYSKKCDGFLVRTGDENGLKLKEYFTNMVNRGNSVNRLSANGDLILNLNSKDIDMLNVSEKDTLTKSSSSDEVIIYVNKLIQKEGAASPCYSIVELYQVDDYQFD